MREFSFSIRRNANSVAQVVALLKSVNASAAVYQLLFTGVERVALGADLYLDVLLGGTCFDNVSASALNGSSLVCGMDSLFHDCHLNP